MSIRLNDKVIAGNSERVNSDWNATSGFAQILNKPENLVHTDGNENISGVKTYNSSPNVPNIATGDSSTKSANTAFVKSSIDEEISYHNASSTAHQLIRQMITDEQSRAEGAETVLTNSINNTNTLLNTTINTTIPGAISDHNTNSNSHKLIQDRLTQEYNERIDDVNQLQEQIDAITASSSIADIVGTYQQLIDYDTSTLHENSIIKVLQDETRANGISYYRWLNSIWNFVGTESPYYSISESDARFVPMTRTINQHDLYNNLTLTLADDFKNDETIYGVKTFNSIPKAPTPTDGTSTSSTQVVTVGWANTDGSTNNIVHKTGTETINGLKTINNGLRINGLSNDGSGQLRLMSADYGFILRNDNSSTYFLLTNSGDNTGTWNNLRPLSINNSTGNVTCSTTWTFSNTIQGTALRAQWADLAEYYLTDKVYPKGTLVMFGGDKEFTIATNKVNGVISTNPALMMNSELKDGQPIALIGRVPVRVIGKVKKFDKIALSYIDGVGCVNNDSESFIGRALEDKLNDDEALVLCSVKINLD